MKPGLTIFCLVVLMTGCASHRPDNSGASKVTKQEMINDFGAPWSVDRNGVHLWIYNRTGSDGFRTTIDTYHIIDQDGVVKTSRVTKSSRPMQVLSAPPHDLNGSDR